jgi:hypothetical protein
MGKRELFLILGFVVVGVIVYQIAAPPAKDGEGFSLTRFWNNARREIGANARTANTTVRGQIPISEGITEIRLTEAPRGLKVVGEDRTDIGYELFVQSTGPDERMALEYAQKSTVVPDELGPTLSLTVKYAGANEGRQTASLVVHMPRKLAVRVQGVAGVQISDVASAALDPVTGDSSVRSVPGAVTGTHRNGSLVLALLGSVKLTVQNSNVKLTGVKNGATLDLRNGSCAIADSNGALELDGTNAEIAVTGHTGRIRIGGSGGRVTLDNPTDETRIDLRKTEVEVTMRSAAPLTVSTTDETLRLFLVGPPPVAIDALADNGRIQAAEFDRTPEHDGTRQRLSAVFGGGTSTKVALRNVRSDIVIRKGK